MTGLLKQVTALPTPPEFVVELCVFPR